MRLYLKFHNKNSKFEVFEVTTLNDLKIFYKLYYDIFSESSEGTLAFEYIHKFWIEDRKTIKLLVGYVNGNPVFFRYIRFNKKDGLIYVPWGGVIKEYRGQSIYPISVNRIDQKLFKEGFRFSINECENPDKVIKKDEAINRLKTFVKKLKFNFVSSQEVPYLRNGYAVEEDNIGFNTIQDYYVLGFKDLSGKKYKHITKDMYLRFYIGIRDFEFGNNQSKYINLPAIVMFLNQLKSYNYERINLLNVEDYETDKRQRDSTRDL